MEHPFVCPDMEQETGCVLAETGSKVAWLDISLIKAGIVGHAPGTL